MNKVAIVTDSNSGITQQQAKEQDIFVLPMPFHINDNTFLEDINLTQEEFYDKLEEGAKIFTSQPSIEEILKLWDCTLKNFDEIVYIPMSSGLSGSYQTAVVLARDYQGKVEVVNNHRISVTQRQSVLDAKALAAQGMSASKIKEILEKEALNSSIYITVNTLKYLKNGGRITKAAAALGTFLKIKPVLQIQGEKLDAFAKARTIRQAKNVMVEAMKHDFETKFETAAKQKEIWLQIAHTNNVKAAKEWKEELAEIFPGYEIYMDNLSLSVSCHIGPGALAIACSKKLIIEK